MRLADVDALPPPHADDELWALTRVEVEGLAGKLSTRDGRRFVKWAQKRWLTEIQAREEAGQQALDAAEVEDAGDLWTIDEATAGALAASVEDPRAAWLLGFLGFEERQGAAAGEHHDPLEVRHRPHACCVVLAFYCVFVLKPSIVMWWWHY